MVLQGTVSRFVVRGVDRRKDSAPNERFKCQWDRSQCASPAFSSPSELFDHLLEHILAIETPEFPCLWSSCSQTPVAKHELRLHLLTHLSAAGSPYPTNSPTNRQPPPPRSTVITYERPTVDPPSTSLTALLIIRILFRTSFASTEVAPRVDDDHFGFPGVVEDTGDIEADTGALSASDREGERRGRKAFVGVRRLLEGVRIRDEVLMSWVTEMVDV